jgi:hypothetical protein
MTHKHFQHLYSSLITSYKSTLVSKSDLLSPSPVYGQSGIAIFKEFQLNHGVLEENAVQDDSLHRT